MNNNESILEVYYTEDGKAYSDFNLIEQAQKIIKDFNNKVSSKRSVSTKNIIQALRVLVSRGEIPYDKICFIFGKERITLDRKGQCSNYPKGFIDWEKGFLEELIKSNFK